ncbi:MAG: AI-2E family transporter [Chloroflexi bacterium]|nr:AI-2E family transporter [Chloroflexota bacterium]
MKDEQMPLVSADPEQEKWAQAADRSRQAWQQLVLRIKSITPASLARILLVTAALGSVVWLFTSTWPALLPFLIGGAIAYAMLPFTNWLDRFMPRAFAVATALLVVLLLLALILYAAVTVAGRQAFMLYDVLPNENQLNATISQLDESLSDLAPPIREIITRVATKLLGQVDIDANTYMDRIVNLIFNGMFGLLNAAGFVLGFLAIPAWLLLVLRDQQAGARALRRLLPRRWLADTMAVWRIFDRSFRAFVQGLLVLALFVTLFVYIGLVFLENVGALSVTFKLGAALFAGFMQLIPTIGPIIVIMVIFLTRMTMFSSTEVLILLGLYLVVQQLLRATAEPRVRKQIAAGVHPALLIMVIVALSQFGFMWVFIAAPVTSVLRDLFLYVYGRFQEPPRPAGLLPGEALPKRKPMRPARRAPSPTIPAAYRHGRAARRSSQINPNERP